MSSPCIRLPKPDLLIKRLEEEYWRRKYTKENCFIGPEESITILENFYSSLKQLSQNEEKT